MASLVRKKGDRWVLQFTLVRRRGTVHLGVMAGQRPRASRRCGMMPKRCLDALGLVLGCNWDGHSRRIYASR